MRKIVLILSIVTLFTSCSIYKKYSRPESISINQLYGDIEKADTTTMADISWHAFFTDLGFKVVNRHDCTSLSL